VGRGDFEFDASLLASTHACFSGSCLHDELPRKYGVAGIFVQPSVFDWLPTTVLEAMSCGCAVVASGVGGIPDMITHEENGLLVKPKDVGGLRDAIRLLASDGSLRERLGRNARRTVFERFTWSKVAPQIEAIYETVLEEVKVENA